MPASSSSLLQSGWSLLSRLATVSPKEPKLTIGLDVGTSSIKTVALGQRRLGPRPVLGQHVLELGSGSEVHLPQAIQRAVAALRVPTKAVSVSVSGQWVIMRVIEMPVMKPDELALALPIEAQRYVPFRIEEVIVDGTILGPADGNKIWVVLVACKRDLVERRVGWVRQAGLEPVVVDVDALAVANAVCAGADNGSSTATRAVINVGTQWTNLAVIKSGNPYLIRDIPWGIEKLSRRVAEQTGLEERAVIGHLKQSEAVPPAVQEAVAIMCESLTTELQLSFDFFENHFGPPPQQLLVTGGAGQSASFLEALKRHVSLPIVPWTPAAGLGGQFTVAYGLALRGGAA
ncbi:MAG: type IV pilus assembly protein PilM [Candidatus Omnitrophica bacterium]|nr:type IV pilus assembly protein PilM [Candidatus Omnitrophota bacterium]